MRKLLITIGLSLMLTLPLMAQTKSADLTSKSNFESSLGNAGSFTKKENTKIGIIEAVGFEAVTLTDLTTLKVIKGLRLNRTYSTQYTSDEKVAFLDFDEIDGFLKVLNYIQTKVINTEVPANDVEYNFYSRGGFVGGSFNDDNKKWKIFLQLEKYGSHSTAFIKAENLQDLIDLLKSAKTSLSK